MNNSTMTNNMNTNKDIECYKNFSSFHKNIYKEEYKIYMILGNDVHNKNKNKNNKPKIFRKFNRKIKHNKNRNIYPMKDTYSR